VVRHQDASVVWFQMGTVPFTANQGVSIGLVLAGLVAWIALRGRTRAQPAPA
jgi:hypothetical protein